MRDALREAATVKVDRSLRILVVDYAIMAPDIISHLEDMGYTPSQICTIDPKEADPLTVLHDVSYDLVIAHWDLAIPQDQDMTTMSGFGLKDAIRQDDELAHTAFVMVSDEGNRDRCEEGARVFITKPIDPEELEAAISRALTLYPQVSTIDSALEPLHAMR